MCDMYTELGNIIVIVVGYLNNEHCRYVHAHLFVVLNTLLYFSLNPLKIGVRSGIRMAQMDLPLPEITKEDFLRV